MSQISTTDHILKSEPARQLKASAITLSTFFLLSALLSAQTIVTTIDDEDDGSAALNTANDVSLREAINHSPSGTIITFAPALNNQTINLSSLGQLTITKDLTIDASSLTSGLTIDANATNSNRLRVLEIQDNFTVALNNLTFTGGWAEDGSDSETTDPEGEDAEDGKDGGGIYIGSDSTVTLTNCTISESQSGAGGNGNAPNSLGGNGGRGGGVGADAGSFVTLIDCTISNNQSSIGGISSDPNGIFVVSSGWGAGIYADGTLIMTNCTISKNQTAINGIGAGICLARNNALTMTGCTISENINDNGSGAGIFILNKTTCTLTDCTISRNHIINGPRTNGAGIRSGSDATLDLINCTISENINDFGDSPGIQTDNGSICTMTGCTISDNQTGDGNGAGIFMRFDCVFNLANCTISDNKTQDGSGAGIFGQSGSELTMTSCTISNNVTENGGGIFGGGGLFLNFGSKATMTSCTISGNQVRDGNGAGIFLAGNGINPNAELFLISCTVSDNQINNSGIGGGIRANLPSPMTLTNCIIAGNRGATGSTDQPGNQTSGVILIGNETQMNNILDGDPGLAPLGDYGGATQTMIPFPTSSAIDSAINITHTTDQRGFTISDGSPDIGAVEFQSTNTELDLVLGLAFDLAFNEDLDQDGISTGLELAMGTNPFAPEASNSAKLNIASFNANGQPTLTFGVDTNQQDNIILRLTRSSDLVNFDKIITTNQNSDFNLGGATLLELDDTTPSAGGKAFYRLEAIKRQ